MGPIPACARAQHGRAISTEVHHAEKFTTRAQPVPIESNAVPDRWNFLTVYERPAFRVFDHTGEGAPFGRAHELGTSRQKIGMTGYRHISAYEAGR